MFMHADMSERGCGLHVRGSGHLEGYVITRAEESDGAATTISTSGCAATISNFIGATRSSTHNRMDKTQQSRTSEHHDDRDYQTPVTTYSCHRSDIITCYECRRGDTSDKTTPGSLEPALSANSMNMLGAVALSLPG